MHCFCQISPLAMQTQSLSLRQSAAMCLQLLNAMQRLTHSPERLLSSQMRSTNHRCFLTTCDGSMRRKKRSGQSSGMSTGTWSMCKRRSACCWQHLAGNAAAGLPVDEGEQKCTQTKHMRKCDTPAVQMQQQIFMARSLNPNSSKLAHSDPREA